MGEETVPRDDLDALLDDALEGFDRPPAQRAAAPAASATAAAAAAAPEAAAGPSSAPAAAQGGPPTSSGRAGGPRGLGFDPLARGPRRGAAAPAPAASAGQAGGSGDQDDPDLEEIDVLSKGLSKLLEELAKAEGEGIHEGEAERGAAAAAGAAGAAAGPSGSQQQQRRDLHATLQALSEQAPSFASGGQPESEEEMLRLLAEQLGALRGEGGAGGGTGGGGTGSTPPEMGSLMESIMHQLLSKEVLYQPMKDIGARYPQWLEENQDKLSAEDLERYRQQQQYIQRICALYESSPSDYPQLVELLQQMQQCGQPPQEIVDELAPGMQFGPDGLPSFGGGDEGLPPDLKDCVIQ